MKKFYFILIALLLTFTSYSQSDDSISTPLKRFWGYGSMGVPHLDLTTSNQDFLSKQLVAYKIPTNPLLTATQYGMHIGFAINKIFLAVHY